MIFERKFNGNLFMSCKDFEKLLNNQRTGEQTYFKKKLSLKLRNTIKIIDLPWVMAVINLTPDSFYTNEPPGQSIDALLKKIENNLPYTNILDIGAVSTRPGAPEIPLEIERQRLIPVLKEIRAAFPNLPISIDTWRSEIARESVNCGADMINDISGGDLDKNMHSTIAGLQVPYVLMHMRGKPENMQLCPEYQDITKELVLYFAQKVGLLKTMGIHDIIIDPGFGFGKTTEQNFTLLRELETFNMLELPLLVGFSRKSMIQKTLGIDAEDALNGTTVLNTIGLQKGADILRVHDPKEAKEACILYYTTA